MSCLHCGEDLHPVVVPEQLESAFSFQDDAFTFVNFADDDGGAMLDADLVARMFGPELACKNGATPCEPTAIADAWRREVNETLHEGRSEGFAVLAQLMSMGEVDPNDFGASTAAELRIEGNRPLQRELAYWAALQKVPSALSDDLRFNARDVMPFLTKALDPSNTERYRLAIAVKTPSGFVRGHGLVPIGFYRAASKGTYHLRVYDNNFPGAARELVIDTVANTWRYETPLPSGEAVVYEGTEENGNLLYFSPIGPRLGTHGAPFGADSLTSSLTSAGAIQVSASIGDGESAGVRDGVVVERGSGRLVPAFAACPLCNPSRGILNYTLSNDLKKNMVVDVTPGKNGEGEGGEGASKISITGPGFATKVTGVDTDKGTGTTLTVEPSGNLTLATSGDSELTLASTRVVGSKESETTVVVAGDAGTGGKTRTVKLTVDEDGRPTVDVSGVPDGTKVTVSYTVVDEKTGEEMASTVEITVKGGATQLKVDPKTGTVRSVTELCSNGKFDAGFEIDTDCGDTCTAACQIGQRCTEQSDCFNRGAVLTGAILCLTDPMDQLRCMEQGCEDGHKTGYETDVDCGSINGQTSGCVPCTSSNSQSAPACDSDDDCGSGGVCRGGCRLKNGIAIDFQGMPVGGIRKGWATIDLKTYQFEEEVVTAGDTRLQLPDGYIYSIYIDNYGTYSCFRRANGVLIETSRHDGRTGYDPNKPGVLDREIVLDCGSSTGDLYLTSTGISDGVEVSLAFSHTEVLGTSSRIRETRVISADSSGMFSQFSGDWDLTVAPQPGQVRIGGAQYYDECLLRLGMGARSASISGRLERSGRQDVALECARHACPYNGLCDGDLSFDVVGLADGDSFRLQDSTGQQRLVLQNGPFAKFGQTESGAWSIVGAPGQTGEGQDKTFKECLFSDGTVQKDVAVGELDVVETITCSEHACPYQDECDGILYVDTTGLVTGLNASVAQSSTVTIAANGTTSFGVGRGTRQLRVTKQPGEHLVSMNKHYNECLWSNGTTTIDAVVAGDDVTQALTCTDHACPYQNYCTTAVSVDVQGMPAGVSVDLRATVGGQVSTHSVTGSGTLKLLDGAGAYTLAVVAQPGVVAVAGGDAHVACLWSNMSSSTSGTLSGETLTLVLNCTATMCPDVLCAQTCTTDSECNSNNCECGVNSGNCTGATGACGKSKAVFDDPTTDGATPTGTFTVPSLCNEVFIQAWGAAGGSSDSGGFMGPGLGNPGGAGGYVSGTLSVAEGDVFTVWVGQGGAFNDTGPGGTPGIGSNLGVEASGGRGDPDFFGGGSGGGGGGLTCLRQVGSANRVVLIPGGGGASASQPGGNDVGTAGGGTEAGSAGGNAELGSVGGGGGAGEYGGAGSLSGEPGLPGSYSSLPAGLMSTDPTDGAVSNASVHDYGACLGIDGAANAGSAGRLGMVSDWGGDGCIVIRCVGY